MKKIIVTALVAIVACVFAASALACATKSISVAQSCDTASGKATVTFTALLGSVNDHANWYTVAPGPVSGGGPGGVLPSDGSGVYTVVEPVGFKGTVTVWEQGSAGQQRGNILSASAVVDGSCQPPKLPHPAHYAPRGRFNGPHGDPMYRAVFDNRGSNRSVIFRFSYHLFGGGREVIIRKVAAHKLARTQYVHVLGGSRMVIYASHKGRIAHKRSAPAGNYGW